MPICHYFTIREHVCGNHSVHAMPCHEAEAQAVHCSFTPLSVAVAGPAVTSPQTDSLLHMCNMCKFVRTCGSGHLVAEASMQPAADIT